MNQEIHKLLYHYRHNPITAIQSIFGVSLDEQQTDLVKAASEPNALVAVKSCKGAGKTATLVWLSIYYMLTRDDCRVLVTAPTAPQLQRVYYSELQKWVHRMPRKLRDFLEIRKESFNVKDVPYQLTSLVTGSPSNQEGLQGGHSKNYIILVDEASGIEETVFDTLFETLGASEDGKMILASNPVRNSGRFYEAFSKRDSIWTQLTFDAFRSNQIQQEWIDRMATQYGEDSDRYKIAVLGEFGTFGESQFFNSRSIEDAQRRTLDPAFYQNFDPVGGLDVARFGDDKTVLITRQGPKITDITEFDGLDTMEVAYKALEYIRLQELTCLYIDGIGIGAGVVDRLKEFRAPIKEVVVSAAPTEPQKYANLRSQLYGRCKEWLENQADIPNDEDLLSQLGATTYTYNNKMQLMIHSKKDIKKTLGVSPDIVDALNLTMADGIYTIASKAKARKVIRRGIRI